MIVPSPYSSFLNHSLASRAARHPQGLNLEPTGLSASSFANCLQSPDAAKIQAYLTAQPSVTVIVGIGPGHGHQKAALTGMQRLNELGFKGRFSIIVENDNKFARDKFKFLVKSYDLKWKLYDERQCPSNQLGLTFACDDHFKRSSAQGFADHYKTSQFVRLGPTGWVKGAHEVFTHGLNVQLASKVAQEGILECNAFTATSDGLRRDVNTLIKGKESGKWQLVLVHGLHDWPSQVSRTPSTPAESVGLSGKDELDILLTALLKRASSKPVAVCVVGQQPTISASIQKASSFKKSIFVSSVLGIPGFHGSNGLASRRLSTGDVGLVHLPQVAEKDFQQLIGHADLIVAEGANSLSAAKKNGTPFLVGGRQTSHGGANNYFLAQEVFLKASRALSTALPISPSKTNERGQRTAALSDYLSECLEGQFSAFYAGGKEQFLDCPDKLFEALRQVT